MRTILCLALAAFLAATPANGRTLGNLLFHGVLGGFGDRWVRAGFAPLDGPEAGVSVRW